MKLFSLFCFCPLPVLIWAQLSWEDATQRAGLIMPQVVMTDPMVGGGAVGDFNDDGWPDIYVLGHHSQRDHLFINQQNGTFREEGLDWGLPDPHFSRGISVADYNGDGFDDVFITSWGIGDDFPNPGKHLLLQNKSGSSFQNVSGTAGVTTTSPVEPSGDGSAWADIDGDGDLDFFVAAWHATETGNRLFINQGDGSFTEETVKRFGSLPNAFGFSPLFADMDGDLDPDLMLIADFGTSRYYANTGGGFFADLTDQNNCCRESNGMGAHVADMDGDGLFDYFATSIFEEVNPVVRDGNYLYRNLGNHQFEALNQGTGFADGGWGWGAVIFDADHDGFLDIAHANGWRNHFFLDDSFRLFRNLGNFLFEDVAIEQGLIDTAQGRGLVHLDYDRDGDMDLVVFNQSAPPSLYENKLVGSDTHWLQVILDQGLSSNIAPRGIGTQIHLLANGKRHVSAIHCNANYLSTSEMVAHVGLGAAQVIDTLEIRWPNGVVSTYTQVAADQRLAISAPPEAGLSQLMPFWLEPFQSCLGTDVSVLSYVEFINQDSQCLPQTVFTHPR
jgi:hypothetical protein